MFVAFASIVRHPHQIAMIPRILHQTWRSADIPAHLHGFHESWRRLHPDWEFRLWTDDDIASLLAEHYPEFLPYFHQAVPRILRVDLARLAYLHRHGGVYADLDYEALRPFDPLLEADRPLVARERRGIGRLLRGRDYVINACLASPPGHPLWLDVMRGMVRIYRPRRPLELHTAHVIRMAIAVLDDEVESRIRTHDDVTILPDASIYPSLPTDRLRDRRVRQAAAANAYGIHHYDNSWRTPLSRLVNRGRALLQRLGP